MQSDILLHMKPVYIWAQTCGIICYSITGEKNKRKIKFKITNVLLHIIKMLIVFYLYYTQDYKFNGGKSLDAMDKIVDKIHLAMVAVMTFVNMMLFQLQSKNLSVFLNDIDKIDLLFLHLGCHIDYHDFKVYCRKLLTFSLIILISIAIGDLNIVGLSNYSMTVAYILILNLHFCAQCTLYAILFHVRLQFLTLNNFVLTVNNEKNVFFNLQKIVYLHGKLRDICNKINNIFNLYFVIFIAVSCTSSTLAVYYAYTIHNYVNFEILQLLNVAVLVHNIVLLNKEVRWFI